MSIEVGMPLYCAVINKNVANLYKEPSTDSEQTTQAVMGQSVQVLDECQDWLHVRTWDTYEAWIRRRWITEASAPTGPVATITCLFSDLYTDSSCTEVLTKLVITTTIECIDVLHDTVVLRLPDARTAWIGRADVLVRERHGSTCPAAPPSELVSTSNRFMGVPYLWGGCTPFGIDCSGLTQLVYRIHGIALPRDAYMQAGDSRGVPVENHDIAPGDLVFFTSGVEHSRITHVGMAYEGNRFIHAAGSGIGVTMGDLDGDLGQRNYACARRFPPQADCRPVSRS